MWGTEATHRNHRVCSPGMPFQGLAATCLGWERGRSVEPTALTLTQVGRMRPVLAVMQIPLLSLASDLLPWACDAKKD